MPAISTVSSQLTTVGNGTLTGALLTGRNITRTGPTSAFTDTTDTASNILSALDISSGELATTSFEVVYSNQSGQTATLAAGSGVTLAEDTGAGSGTIPTGVAATLLISVTAGAVTVEILYRTATE
jgi:hypothetical protein